MTFQVVRSGKKEKRADKGIENDKDGQSGRMDAILVLRTGVSDKVPFEQNGQRDGEGIQGQ